LGYSSSIPFSSYCFQLIDMRQQYDLDIAGDAAPIRFGQGTDRGPEIRIGYAEVQYFAGRGRRPPRALGSKGCHVVFPRIGAKRAYSARSNTKESQIGSHFVLQVVD
jgi:hypothetical protein